MSSPLPKALRVHADRAAESGLEAYLRRSATPSVRFERAGAQGFEKKEKRRSIDMYAPCHRPA